MKNEFKKDSLYFTKDKKIGKILSINDKAMLVQVEGVTYGYYLDGKIVLPQDVEDKDSYSLLKLFTKRDAEIMMNCGQKVQHLDWLKEEGGKKWFYCFNQDHKIVNEDGNIIFGWKEYVDGDDCWQVFDNSLSMEDYMGYLTDTIAQIKALSHYGCCDQKEKYVMEEVFNSLNTNFSDYDTFCSENKAMAEFLTSLGYSQEQVTDIANGGKPKTEIQLLQAEVAEMEKDGMANINAIERFNRKIESLQNHSVITVEAMGEISSKSKQCAMDDIYSSFPEDMGTEELWETIMTNDEFNHDDLVICEKYECCSIDIIREQLDIISSVYEKYALEIINLVKPSLKPIQTQNILLLYKTSVQELSEDVVVMLDGESDYVAIGLGRGSMIFDLDTLKTILSSYEEDMGDEEAPDIGSDSSYLEFSALIEKVAMNGCKGLFLTNGGNHE